MICFSSSHYIGVRSVVGFYRPFSDTDGVIDWLPENPIIWEGKVILQLFIIVCQKWHLFYFSTEMSSLEDSFRILNLSIV